jgi:hypothetical protein
MPSESRVHAAARMTDRATRCCAVHRTGLQDQLHLKTDRDHAANFQTVACTLQLLSALLGNDGALVTFVNMRGPELVLPLLQRQDSSVVSWALCCRRHGPVEDRCLTRLDACAKVVGALAGASPGLRCAVPARFF